MSSINGNILVFSESADTLPDGVHIDSGFTPYFVSDLQSAIDEMISQKYQTMLLTGEKFSSFIADQRDSVARSIVDVLPVGFALINERHVIVKCNQQLKTWARVDEPEGQNFFEVFDSPFICDGNYAPFSCALKSGSPSHCEMQDANGRYFQIDVAPYRPLEASLFVGTPFVSEPSQEKQERCLVVVLREITSLNRLLQKFSALQKESVGLTDLSLQDILSMSETDRINFLKIKIAAVTQNILNYSIIEIRRLVPHLGLLEPILAIGMAPEAVHRTLYAVPRGNGITGYVAATGKSYLCEDTSEDVLYLRGSVDSKSSITVPLIFHDEVIGTMNVESPEPNAFTQQDLQFLELFSQNVALSLHTMDLLTAERVGTAVASVEAIHRAVAMPVDQILNTTVKIINSLTEQSAISDDLRLILQKAREIKSVVLEVGETLKPIQAHPVSLQSEEHPILRNCNVLVVDRDESVAIAAGEYLLQYQGTVESAPNGETALSMIANTKYDAILSDISLPDMSGYEFLQKVRGQLGREEVPLILVKGFGHDKEHIIVKARQSGLTSCLAKPIRKQHLHEVLESVFLKQRRVFSDF